MLAIQILIDGFAISTLYALGALGFTLIFGVSGVLNLAHGGLMVIAAMIAWYLDTSLGFGPYVGALAGVAVCLVAALVTYGGIVRPIENSRAVPAHERELFVLTATLLWGVMIQESLSYAFTNSPITVQPLIAGTVSILGVRTPINEIFIAAVAWAVMGALWLLVNRTQVGRRLLAASINPRALTLLGFELDRIYLFVWVIYGLLAGIAGVLLGSFLGSGSDYVPGLTGSAFTIVVLGGLGSVSGTLIAAYIVGYIETVTAYLVSPSLREVPALILLVVVIYMRPQGLLGRR
ncbi:MAG TPA: branched-chain amino acid ABC transporter permease [Acidiphilium sp.]|uniref:branched-chain amino acid ABC transporter permease n=1 Tax=unclassified Acidiphilium TaxID=2617493 RepID=UPI000BD50189|nr:MULTISPECIES: branched-chain amino acid ABC transporter permease [unclassified Acidiphilium]OYV57032.1 MAG: branched-chain amino acid ABC transporter permease [Acidiphilium sp. 20-67-58]HQT61799.1 branched-chain amino acid ABC transporter permease [Acidiphilium sp.]HQU12006.1 branched-chain amino acid ABC transporter permease [Acidiphilium sp.]